MRQVINSTKDPRLKGIGVRIICPPAGDTSVYRGTPEIDANAGVTWEVPVPPKKGRNKIKRSVPIALSQFVPHVVRLFYP